MNAVQNTRRLEKTMYQNFDNVASKAYKQELQRLDDEKTKREIKKAIKTDFFGLDERQLACKVKRPIHVIQRLLVEMEITKHGGKLVL